KSCVIIHDNNGFYIKDTNNKEIIYKFKNINPKLNPEEREKGRFVKEYSGNERVVYEICVSGNGKWIFAVVKEGQYEENIWMIETEKFTITRILAAGYSVTKLSS